MGRTCASVRSTPSTVVDRGVPRQRSSSVKSAMTWLAPALRSASAPGPRPIPRKRHPRALAARRSHTPSPTYTTSVFADRPCSARARANAVFRMCSRLGESSPVAVGRCPRFRPAHRTLSRKAALHAPVAIAHRKRSWSSSTDNRVPAPGTARQRAGASARASLTSFTNSSPTASISFMDAGRPARRSMSSAATPPSVTLRYVDQSGSIPSRPRTLSSACRYSSVSSAMDCVSVPSTSNTTRVFITDSRRAFYMSPVVPKERSSRPAG